MSDTTSLSDPEKLQQVIATLEKTSKRLQLVSTINIVLVVLLLIFLFL